MKKILIVFGTRPEAIKMAPLVKAFKEQNTLFDCKVCSTGQHKEMLDQVLKVFDIDPEYKLSVMREGQNLTGLSARILTEIQGVLSDYQPDVVLVHGDTTTSTMSALASFYQKIPVGHVEAGLRTNNIYSPWPEEVNRQITGRIATYHFAPTNASLNNLLKEGIRKDRIAVTGNTVIDALKMAVDKLHSDGNIAGEILNELSERNIKKDLVQQWGKERRLILITGHRRENFGSGFIHICEAIKEMASNFPDVDFVYPVHLNPSVLEPVYKILGRNESNEKENSNIYLTQPLDYLPFVFLMEKSYLILTDSGGIQEEAPGLGKPVVVMRDTTERPEAVESGTVVLTGTDKDKIMEVINKLLTDKVAYEVMTKAHNPYGDGHAAEKIIKVLRSRLSLS